MFFLSNYQHHGWITGLIRRIIHVFLVPIEFNTLLCSVCLFLSDLVDRPDSVQLCVDPNSVHKQESIIHPRSHTHISEISSSALCQKTVLRFFTFVTEIGGSSSLCCRRWAVRHQSVRDGRSSNHSLFLYPVYSDSRLNIHSVTGRSDLSSPLSDWWWTESSALSSTLRLKANWIFLAHWI